MKHIESSSSEQFNFWQQWAFRIEQKIQEQQDVIDTLLTTIEILRHQIEQQESMTGYNKNDCQAPVFHVDKIEYHFDQLKVETLEGSLQIGMTTASGSQLPTMIEDLALKQANSANLPGKGKQIPVQNKSNGINSNFTNGHKKTTKPIANTPYEGLKTSSANSLVRESPPSNQTSNFSIPAGFEQYLYEQLRDYLHIHGPSYIASQAHSMQISINDEHTLKMIQDLEKQLPSRIQHYCNNDSHLIYAQYARDEQKMWEQLQLVVQQKTWQDIQLAIRNYFESKQK